MDGYCRTAPQGLPEIQDPRLGRVISVSAARVIMLLEGDGAVAEAASMALGTIVKVPTAGATVYGMVSGLRMPLPSVAPDAEELKVVEIDLVGEVVCRDDGEPPAFRRGVSVFPVLA